MRRNEGVLKVTNAVIYYSNTGESKCIATFLADTLGYDLTDVFNVDDCNFATAVLVFPVHCQNVPKVILDFLRRLSACNVALVATYGKMSYGNVLNEIQRKFKHNIVAAAYVPTKHTYVDEPRFDDFSALLPVADKLQKPSPTAVTLPRARKNPFANFAPTFRSQAGCKLIRDGDKCANCGTCASICPERAITNGKPNKKCVRCLKCVNACPHGALSYKLRLPLKNYLKKPKITDLVIYV